jgi:hypothetical protein
MMALNLAQVDNKHVIKILDFYWLKLLQRNTWRERVRHEPKKIVHVKAKSKKIYSIVLE